MLKFRELLDYISARKEIYLKTYLWVLENKIQNVIQLLRQEAEKRDIVLLDYNTNSDIEDIKKPLSHAFLVKNYLEKKYPELSLIKFGNTIQKGKIQTGKRNRTRGNDFGIPKIKRKSKQKNLEDNVKQLKLFN